MKTLVTNIQRFSIHDGPGIRTTVFLKGCPLNCKWCHNPETIKQNNEIFYIQNLCIGCGLCTNVCPTKAHIFSKERDHVYDVTKCTYCMRCADICPSKAIEAVGRVMTAEEVFKEVLSDKAFYGNNGGMTLSGGEPLLHMDMCLALLKLANNEGIHTAIETCGNFDEKYIEQIAPLTDLFLWDYKDTNGLRHKQNTGVFNERIISNLMTIDKYNVEIILRCIMLKSMNMDNFHLNGIAEIYHKLEHCKGVELLPYHTFGGAKKRNLGYSDNSCPEWVPSAEDLSSFMSALIKKGVKII